MRDVGRHGGCDADRCIYGPGDPCGVVALAQLAEAHDEARALRAQLAAVEREVSGARTALGEWSKHEIGQTLVGGINNLRQAEMTARDIAHSRITKCSRCNELTAERDRNREDALYYVKRAEQRSVQLAAAEACVAEVEGALREGLQLLDEEAVVHPNQGERFNKARRLLSRAALRATPGGHE